MGSWQKSIILSVALKKPSVNHTSGSSVMSIPDEIAGWQLKSKRDIPVFDVTALLSVHSKRRCHFLALHPVNDLLNTFALTLRRDLTTPLPPMCSIHVWQLPFAPMIASQNSRSSTSSVVSRLATTALKTDRSYNRRRPPKKHLQRACHAKGSGSDEARTTACFGDLIEKVLKR
jgi:hypothetical protein